MKLGQIAYPLERSAQHPVYPRSPDRSDEYLLAAVDFKWLMAGHGWWIDTTRVHRDASYAARLLTSALDFHSSSLRDCAAWLASRCEGLASRDCANPEPAR